MSEVYDLVVTFHEELKSEQHTETTKVTIEEPALKEGSLVETAGHYLESEGHSVSEKKSEPIVELQKLRLERNGYVAVLLDTWNPDTHRASAVRAAIPKSWLHSDSSGSARLMSAACEVYKGNINSISCCGSFEYPQQGGGVDWVEAYGLVIEFAGAPTHRPYRNAVEFYPYRDSWLKKRDADQFARATFFDDTGVILGQVFKSYRELLKQYVFAAPGNRPCGVAI